MVRIEIHLLSLELSEAVRVDRREHIDSIVNPAEVTWNAPPWGGHKIKFSEGLDAISQPTNLGIYIHGVLEHPDGVGVVDREPLAELCVKLLRGDRPEIASSDMLSRHPTHRCADIHTNYPAPNDLYQSFGNPTNTASEIENHVVSRERDLSLHLLNEVGVSLSQRSSVDIDSVLVSINSRARLGSSVSKKWGRKFATRSESDDIQNRVRGGPDAVQG